MSIPTNELMCPISMDWLQDPVILPCCGRAISRQSILSNLPHSNSCPFCKSHLTEAAINQLPKCINLAYLVEEAQKELIDPSLFQPANQNNKWKATINKLTYNRSTVGQLTITNTDNSFNFKTLLLVVVDKSGSMAGTPMMHCHYSLNRVLDLSYKHKQLQTNIITYDDNAKTYPINTTQMIEIHKNEISRIAGGGGTSFTSAFNEVIKVCTQHNADNMISSMVTVFLTDGEDSSVTKDKRGELVTQLKNNINKVWQKPYTIHTVGFGASHDYDFLDNLRKIGTTEGAFRFATNGEDSDSLSGKINSILDVIAESSAIPIKLITTENLQIISGDSNKYWLNLTTFNPQTITISINDSDLINIETEYSDDINAPETISEYISFLIDQIASELLTLSTANNSIDKELHCEILLQRSRAICSKLDDKSPNATRLNALIENIKIVQQGGKVNQQKLNDMSFEGKFATKTTTQPTPSILPAYNNPTTYTPRKYSYWSTIQKPQIKRCTANKHSKEIFQVIGQYKTSDACDWLSSNSDQYDITDKNDADALLVAASIGRVALVKTILTWSVASQTENCKGYNAIDMAILFGYWNTYCQLRDVDFVPSLNITDLLRTCISNKYYKMAELLIQDNSITITKEIIDSSPNYEATLFLTKYLKEEITLETAIKKGLYDTVVKQLDTVKYVPWLPISEIFNKPTTEHLKIIGLLLSNKKINPLDIAELNDAEKEISWPLFVACEKGQTELVKLLLSHTDLSKINQQNRKGTTCLWIASCNRHIDIVSDLLTIGADPNLANFKGDSPLIPACQKGAESIVELLLACGADLTSYNKNRDNPILICCRTGQHKILDNLLARFDKPDLETILNTYAEIDGFVPLLAATELDKVECIKVCIKYGAPIEHTTNPDNPIISGATALHLACFYNRLDSLKTLQELKANLLVQTTVDKSTPLHIAIKQNHPNIVRYLLSTPEGKACLQIPDSDNRLPTYYATGTISEEFFTNKLATILDKVMFSTQEIETKCSNILTKYGQSLGYYDYDDITTITYDNGSSLLSKSLLHNNTQLTSSLMQMNANINQQDDYGITPEFWLSYLQNTASQNPQIEIMQNRVQKVIKSNIQNKLLLQLQPIKEQLLLESPTQQIKMNDGYQNKVNPNTLSLLETSSKLNHSLLGFIEKLKNKTVFPDGKQCLEYILWEAKINVIKKIASGCDNNLQPIHLLALYLFGSNLTIFKNVNSSITNWTGDNPWNPFICCLYQAINLVPYYTGEVYRGINTPFNSKEYNIGDTLNWNNFSVCSSEWKNLNDLIKQRKGIIFIINSKTGRDISSFTKNPQDKDVLFLPNSKFLITNFYKMDNICLAQKNIRTTTFKVKPEELSKLTGIIIELDQIVDGKLLQ